MAGWLAFVLVFSEMGGQLRFTLRNSLCPFSFNYFLGNGENEIFYMSRVHF